jgi:hypothetical protein
MNLVSIRARQHFIEIDRARNFFVIIFTSALNSIAHETKHLHTV